MVYNARDLHLDRFVALKILPPEKVADLERIRRFIQEAKASCNINGSSASFGRTTVCPHIAIEMARQAFHRFGYYR